MSLPAPHVTQKTPDGLLTPIATALLYSTDLILTSFIQLPTPSFVVALSSLALPHFISQLQTLLLPYSHTFWLLFLVSVK